jgi:hypothetical protein
VDLVPRKPVTYSPAVASIFKTLMAGWWFSFTRSENAFLTANLSTEIGIMSLTFLRESFGSDWMASFWCIHDSRVLRLRYQYMRISGVFDYRLESEAEGLYKLIIKVS